MNSSKYLSGLLAGMAIGTIAGILLAPEKGCDTRKKIMKSGEDLANDIKGKVLEFADSLKDSLHTAKENVENSVANGESKLAGMKGNIYKV